MQGISQAFGLTQTQVLGIGVTGTATNSFNILWPQSTNQVTVGFVVVSSSNSFAPTQVLHFEPLCGMQTDIQIKGILSLAALQTKSAVCLSYTGITHSFPKASS